VSELFLDGRVELRCGDNREVLRAQPDSSIDSIVTDPPYALVSIVKRFGKAGSAAVKVPADGSGAYARASAGFMGKAWDTGETAFAADFWAECLRVLKPGGHVVAFSGTRTYHRMVCAIEDAGFEIRDSLQWLYGSGFPKSHNVAKSLGRELAGPELREEWEGWGTALKPAVEPICLARKPLVGTVAQNVIKHGTGAINIEGCRVGLNGEMTVRSRNVSYGSLHEGRDKKGGIAGVGGSDAGRWPANIVHDGSEEVLEAFPEAPGQQRGVGPQHGAKDSVNVYGDYGARDQFDPRGDSGSAARFFYTAKADADDRIGSRHPTVKPVDLMQWLCRLVTPKGGTVLDPFAGTGTTGEAAFREGFKAILIERESEYQDDIRRRMALVMAGPEERRRESIKAKGAVVDAGPLFGGASE
jgi:site-specific DNA-methyltransferase (adenine-specific)